MKYILRSFKYLVKLAVLLAVIFVLMKVSGTSNIESESLLGFWKNFFATERGRIFTVVLVVWCGVYPAVEYKRRHLNYDMTTRRQAITAALAAGGMRLASDDGKRMVFRGTSPLRRVWWLGEEAVTVTMANEGGIDIEGPRRFVMEAEHRIPNYVGMEN